MFNRGGGIVNKFYRCNSNCYTCSKKNINLYFWLNIEFYCENLTLYYPPGSNIKPHITCLYYYLIKNSYYRYSKLRFSINSEFADCSFDSKSLYLTDSSPEHLSM